ncbi:hypothetical protein GF318_06195 [Candidatus Micrarchaeota archaeon]|nr:hypothetical protein [Candidatus Micrarchaeota archaeon]
MDYQEKTILLVVLLLSALAVYFVFTAETPEIPEQEEDVSEAEALLLKGVSFGKGHDNYIYAYTETADGYVTEYGLTSNGDRQLVEVRNLLSNKKAYYLENDTVLCIEYPPGEEVCSSVKGKSRVENYMRSLEVKLLNDTLIENGVRNTQYLLDQGYIRLSPNITNRSNCREISYQIDYTDASVGDAARFGIGINTPKIFNVTMCVNNRSGYMHERSVTYEQEGTVHYKNTSLVSFSSMSSAIEAPQNLSTGAITALEKEREQQVRLVGCFTTKEGEERDKCIATIALDLERKDLCEYAGDRRGRCLVSIVPLTLDEGICPTIQDQSFRDDCYTELAGAYQDSSYCEQVQDPEKKDFCTEIAVPEEEEEEPDTNQNESGNESDILDFMEYVDQYGEEANETGGGNETNATNTTQ